MFSIDFRTVAPCALLGLIVDRHEYILTFAGQPPVTTANVTAIATNVL